MSEATPRVFELARALGVSSSELIERLRALSPDAPSSNFAAVPEGMVEQVTASVVAVERGDGAAEDLESRGAELIRGAFVRARDSGRDDWRRMTVAVLKNRLLDATDRRFDERDWGVSGIREFAELYTGLVRLDSTRMPPTIELLGELQAAPAPPAGSRAGDADRASGPHKRIRPDLWKAALDYASDQVYVWSAGRAVGKPAADPGDVVIPTIARDGLAEWRRAFAERLEVDDSQRDAVDRWVEEGLRTADLPARVRPLWNSELKQRVLAHLRHWFAEAGFEVPADIVAVSARVVPPDAGTEELRTFILRCVRAMTGDELEALQLPAAAVLRLERR